MLAVMHDVGDVSVKVHGIIRERVRPLSPGLPGRVQLGGRVVREQHDLICSTYTHLHALTCTYMHLHALACTILARTYMHITSMHCHAHYLHAAASYLHALACTLLTCTYYACSHEVQLGTLVPRDEEDIGEEPNSSPLLEPRSLVLRMSTAWPEGSKGPFDPFWPSSALSTLPLSPVRSGRAGVPFSEGP